MMGPCMWWDHHISCSTIDLRETMIYYTCGDKNFNIVKMARPTMEMLINKVRMNVMKTFWQVWKVLLRTKENKSPQCIDME